MTKANRDLPMFYRGQDEEGVDFIRVDGKEDQELVEFDVVFSKGARVRRHGFMPDGEFGMWDEELSMDPEAVDLSRLNNGAPVLNSHNAWDLSSVLGKTVEGTAEVVEGEGRARIRMSSRKDVAGVVQDMKDRILKKLSAGYRALRFEVDKQGAVPLFRATKWQPREISVVSVAADDAAEVRSAKQQVEACEIVYLERGDEMSKSSKQKENAAAATSDEAVGVAQEVRNESAVAAVTAAEVVDVDKVRNDAIAEERARVTGINDAVRKAGLSQTRADELVSGGHTIDQAREMIIEDLATQSEQRSVSSAQVMSTPSGDDPAVLCGRMATALASRLYEKVELSDEAREYRGYSVLDMAAELLEKRGERVRRGDRADLVHRSMHSTSDFPILLEAAANKILLPAYEAAPNTFKMIAQRMTFSDFNERKLVRDGDFPELVKVGEGGEFEAGTMGEAKETAKLETFGRTIALTRQALINDDLGVFSKSMQKAGLAAARLENKIGWDLITSNPDMSDGVSFFNADHGNLSASAGAPSVATLGKGRKALRVQKSIDKNPINVTARYIVIPTALETSVEQLLADIVVPTKSADVVPTSLKRLQPIAEPLLDADSETNWYLFADPAVLASVVHLYLEGNEEPFIDTRDGWSVDGAEMKVRHDTGAAMVDYRGGYKNG